MDAIDSQRLKRSAHCTVGNEGSPVPAEVPVSAYLARKMTMDRILAAMLLIPVLPLIGLLATFIKLTSRGPAIFKQERVGCNGRAYTMYKLRSMHVDAEAGSGPVWAKQDDPRTTWLGRMLRRLHLDELPQLFNVLKGEMSLVGPRPERPEFVVVLRQMIPGYEHRLLAVPGVTGLAQLGLPADSDLQSVRRKLAVDVRYIEHASLWMDLRILFYTGARLFKIPVRLLSIATGLGPWLEAPHLEGLHPTSGKKVAAPTHRRPSKRKHRRRRIASPETLSLADTESCATPSRGDREPSTAAQPG